MTQEEFEKLMNEMHTALQPKAVYIEYITQILYSPMLGVFEVNVN